MRSVNQNHHLYVVTSTANPAGNSAAVGSIYPHVSGENAMDKDLYFTYKGWDGVVRSDLIPVNQITYIKHIKAEAQVSYLREITVSLNSDALDPDTNTPYAGKDYILNIEFRQFYGLSPEDTYVKTVGVHATRNMSVSDFWDAMINELNASFSREIGADATSNPYLTFTKSGSNLVITEKEQNWSLGKWEAESLMFDVFPSTISVAGDEITWGSRVIGVSNTTVPNSKKMADLEWFTFGERADIYRGMGYPNNFEFRPLIVPTDANGYDVLEIHYAYQGTCEDIQKSEKDITLVGSAKDISHLVEALSSEDYLNMTIPVVPAEEESEEEEP